MTARLELSRERARRLAVIGQRLSAPRPRSIEEAVHDLWSVQLDPTQAVARTEQLVLWSRLGRAFRVRDLERQLWDERRLFEYWVHILPIGDFPIHRETMRRYPDGGPEAARRTYVSEWLRANAAFRRYILAELRRRGPLRARELEDRSVVSWKTGGWNDQTETSAARNLGQMLDRLWFRGEVMIVGRDGQQRIWDLAERTVPVNAPRLPARETARRILSRQLRARGVATVRQFGYAFDGRPTGWERALDDLVKEGVAVPARIDGLRGDWFAHADLIDATFRPRSVLLSPFDDLVSDRNHTEQLFGFRFRLEIYVPKAKREFGYFVLPILRGDRLIGRIDPLFDRGAGVLRVHSVYAEEGATPADGAAAAKAIGELAAWLGASDVAFGRTMPARWRRALRA